MSLSPIVDSWSILHGWSQALQLVHIFHYFVADKTLIVRNLSLALTQVTNWHTLGIRLGVPPYQLKHIEQNYSMNSERCKNEMLSVWLQTSPAACWRDVVRALHEMEHHVLAKIIHRDYDQGLLLITYILA